MTHQRRNRVLCLHGPEQSAASFRAALKPVCDILPSSWEFHFLDAPFIMTDESDGESGSSSSTSDAADRWSRAAIDASRIVALEAELATVRQGRGSQQAAEQALVQELQALQRQIEATHEGKQTWDAQQQAGGADAVEALLSTKVARSMSRDWTVTCADGRQAGIDVGVGMIGDYMREQGTFHAVIGCASGGSLGASADSDIAILLQALLSHPRSSTQAFPTFFAQLPKGVQRMPRMGGWEEEPPAPDDPRLGNENLTKDFVPAQRPFEALVALQVNGSSHDEFTETSLGLRARNWIQEKRPILGTVDGSFASHSLAVQQESQTPRNPSMSATDRPETTLQCAPGDDVFDKAWSAYYASWLRLAVASCAGDHAARKQLQSLRREDASKPHL